MWDMMRIVSWILFRCNDLGMYMASFDWRLPFEYLETRDLYFTRLKHNIEWMKRLNGNKLKVNLEYAHLVRKVVIITHSMGGNVVLYFFGWIKSPTGSICIFIEISRRK